MARNKKSTFSFGADDGLDFATINNKIDNVTLSDNSSNNEKTEAPINSENQNAINAEDKNNDLENTITKTKLENSNVQQNDEPVPIQKKDSIVSTKENYTNEITAENDDITLLQNNKKTFYNIDKLKPIKEQNIPYKQDNCKPRVATILEEYMRFVRVRSKKLGIPLNLYINIIIDEYKASIEKIDDEERYSSLYNTLSRQYKGSKLRTNFFLIPENADFIEDEITNIGCQPSQYFNYIIDLEIQREKAYGMRL